MATPTPDLEELLFDAQDCVTRWKAGRVEATAAAIDGGNILTMAHGLTGHGDWLDWLDKVGLTPTTASRWMRLAALGLGRRGSRGTGRGERRSQGDIHAGRAPTSGPCPNALRK